MALALVGVRFENVGPQAGFTRAIPNGGDQSKQFIIETTGSGVAFIDYDNDGLLDAFVASGPGLGSRLYRNAGGGRFEDVSEAMGIRGEGWAQGVCAGDYDNDGFTDLFVTYWGANRLYRNVGGKRFEDVTAKAGLGQDRVRYNTGCAFLDYDKDGRLDLFVANYLKFDPATTPKPGANPYCFYREMAVNCGPRGLPYDRNILYHAGQDGRFTDVSVESGVAAPDRNYSLGVLVGDFNNDGWPDIYVACDQTPSLLYINQGNGKFEEEGLERGAAFDSNGKALSGMGVSAADYELSGAFGIFRSNFSDERETLYRPQNRKGEFEDATIAAGLAKNTRFVGWGCGFFDFDNDGYKDLLIVNGHVFPEVERLKLDIHYRDRAILYRNLGNGKFEDVSEAAGGGIAERHSSRGAAFGDIDNDGRVEVLVNNQNEAPSLLRTSGPVGHWAIFKLTGVKSNRSAIGARVRVTVGGRTQMDEVRSGGSYLSQGDLRLHFGLGPVGKMDRVEIEWPSGVRQVLRDVAGDRVIPVVEGNLENEANLALKSLKPGGLGGFVVAAALASIRPSAGERMLSELGASEEGLILYRLASGDVRVPVEAPAATPSAQLLFYRLDGAGATDFYRSMMAAMPAAITKRADAEFLARNLGAISRNEPTLGAQAAARLKASGFGEYRPGPFVGEMPKVPAGFGEAVRAELDGAFGLKAWRGRPAMVAFWATWCAPCRRELPRLSKLGIPLLGVTDEDPGVVEGYLKESGVKLTPVYDPGGVIRERFEVSSLPVVLLIDGEGKVLRRFENEPTDAEIRALIQ